MDEFPAERTVIVTGAVALRGIGRATVHFLAERGWNIGVIDLDDAASKAVAQELTEKYGVKAAGAGANVADEVSVRAAIDELEAALPQIVALTNVAGVSSPVPYLELDSAEWDRVMNINLNSVFWMCQNFIKLRGKKGGIIINISSIEAILPFKEELVQYSVSKAGVIALTRSLARDYGRKGFRANVILPGAIRTPGTTSLAKDAIANFRLDLMKTGYDFQTRLALGRWGHPDEIAKVALFLASDLASYVQGAMIPVDGGFLSS